MLGEVLLGWLGDMGGGARGRTTGTEAHVRAERSVAIAVHIIVHFTEALCFVITVTGSRTATREKPQARVWRGDGQGVAKGGNDRGCIVHMHSSIAHDALLVRVHRERVTCCVRGSLHAHALAKTQHASIGIGVVGT
jgi:hypothetical protein